MTLNLPDEPAGTEKSKQNLNCKEMHEENRTEKAQGQLQEVVRPCGRGQSPPVTPPSSRGYLQCHQQAGRALSPPPRVGPRELPADRAKNPRGTRLLSQRRGVPEAELRLAADTVSDSSLLQRGLIYRAPRSRGDPKFGQRKSRFTGACLGLMPGAVTVLSSPRTPRCYLNTQMPTHNPGPDCSPHAQVSPVLPRVPGDAHTPKNSLWTVCTLGIPHIHPRTPQGGR